MVCHVIFETPMVKHQVIDPLICPLCYYQFVWVMAVIHVVILVGSDGNNSLNMEPLFVSNSWACSACRTSVNKDLVPVAVMIVGKSFMSHYHVVATHRIFPRYVPIAPHFRNHAMSHMSGTV